MTVRAQAPSGFLTVETEAEIHARPRRRLDASERRAVASATNVFLAWMTTGPQACAAFTTASRIGRRCGRSAY